MIFLLDSIIKERKQESKQMKINGQYKNISGSKISEI